MADSSSDATFPVGAYAKYKRATKFFLDWLVRASDEGPQSNTQPVALDTLNLIVGLLVKSASASHGQQLQATKTKNPKMQLATSKLKGLAKALGACQCAIRLRELVADFFRATGAGEEAQATHRHFLELLQDWNTKLSVIESFQRLEQHAPSQETPEMFANYFQGLCLGDDDGDDDHDDHDETIKADSGDSNKHLSAESREHEKARSGERWATLFDKEFIENLQFELECFVVEMDALLKSVFLAYREVKLQRQTLMEAAAVVIMAMEGADAAMAKLQLSFPVLSAQHLVGNMQLYHADSLMASAKMAREKDHDLASGSYEYKSNALPYDFVAISGLLTTFSSFMPADDGMPFPFRRTEDILYCEELTPERMSSYKDAFATFLLQQLITLYNALRLPEQPVVKSSGRLGGFLRTMDAYFQTKQVPVSLVFAVLCWIQSVSALQGNAGLGRSISLSIQHVWKLSDTVETALKDAKVASAITRQLKALSVQLGLFNRSLGMLRTNPVLTGLLELDFHLQYLHVGYEALIDSRTLQVFQGIHNILDRNRPTDTWVPLYIQNWGLDRFKSFRDLSLIYRLMIVSDTASLGDDEFHGSSAAELLAKVSSVFSKELYDTRILAEDSLLVLQDISRFLDDLSEARGGIEVDAAWVQAFERRNSKSSIYKRVFEFYTLRFTVNPDAKYLLARENARLVDEEFGTQSIREAIELGSNTDLSELQTLLRSKSALTMDQERNLKDRIRENPWVLRVVGVLSEDESDAGDLFVGNSLCTLFHLAAAGPVHSLRLVEWMIQLGALHYQPSTERVTLGRDEDLPDLLAVHCAAIHGHTAIVQLILEAEGYRDVDTCTFRTRKSLVHLAAAKGHDDLCGLLVRQQANLQLRDASGKRAFELAKDPDLINMLKRATDFQLDAFRSDDTTRWVKKKLALSYRRIQDEQLQGLKAVTEQQIRERRAAQKSTRTSKRGHKKKKKK